MGKPQIRNNSRLIRQKRAYGSRTSFFFACVVPLLISFSAAATSSIRVFTGKDAKNPSIDVERFFRLCELEVARILPRHGPGNHALEYSIIAVPAKRLKRKSKISTATRGKVRIYLSDALGDDFGNDKPLLAKLAAVVILKNAGNFSAKDYLKIPKWIVYGILRKVLRRLKHQRIYGLVVFPGVHALLISGTPPDFMKILSDPLAPGDGPAFDLSMEIAEITLNAVTRLPKGKRLLADIVNLAMKGVPADTSFRGALGDPVRSVVAGQIGESKNASQDEPFAIWLGRAAMTSAVNIFNPLDATSAEKAYLKYSKVRYETKERSTPSGIERPSETRCCTLSDLPDEWGKMKSPEMVFKRKQRDMALLAMMLPSALQSPLNKMREAMTFVERKKPEAFKKQLSAAESDFYRALDRRQQIEAYIDGVERSRVPPSYLYAPQLREIGVAGRKRKCLCPGLRSYMDAKEKSIH